MATVERMFDLADAADSATRTCDDDPTAAAGPDALAIVLVASAARALSAAAQLAADELDDATLTDVVLGVEQLRRAVDATEAHALAELHDRGTTDRTAGLATSQWLAREAALPHGVARERLRVANRLSSDLGVVDDALSAGRIGAEHARAVADAVNERNGAALARELPDLLDRAPHTVFADWRAELATRAELLDDDGPFDPNAELARNRLRLSPTTGLTMLRGELTAEHDRVVNETLGTIADELFLQYTRDATLDPDLQVPSRPTLLALALEEACRRALAVDLDASRSPRTDTTIVLHAHPRRGSGGDVDLGLHTDWMLTHAAQPWLTPMPAAVVGLLTCDTALHTVLLDGLGVPLEAGRDHRHPTPAQRRALAARDGGCTFPGCTTPPTWCDAHHLVHWRHGGRTDLDNLILVCRHHHRVAHRSGWTVTLSDDQWTDWTAPDGSIHGGQRHHARAGP